MIVRRIWYHLFVNSLNLPQLSSLFSVILSLGAILGLSLTVWRADSRKIFYMDVGIGLMLGAALGARAGFVLRNWGYFQTSAAEIPQIWLGGLTWPGAGIGTFLALLAISLATKHHLGELADALLPLIGALTVSLWLAAWADGNIYGPPTTAWWGMPTANQFGEIARRWPLPALGAILSGLLVLAAEWARAKVWSKFPGRSAALGALGVSLTNLIISLFRVDPAPYFRGLRWGSWFAIFFVIASSVALFFLWKNEETESE